MEQKDYILKEIQKIGLILSAIRQKLFGGKSNLSITFECQIDATKDMLFNEIDFDLDKFLTLNMEDANEYICSFQGFNIDNIEALAEYLSQIGFNDESGKFKNYLEKALQLYELCNLKSDTYSFERERNIRVIKDAL